MLSVVIRTVVGIAAAVGVVGVAFAVSFRTKFQPVQRMIRRVNRDFTNPRVLRSAGQPGASASVVHHVGRRSGRAYRTPATAVPDADGFLFALPYGAGADWVRNVLAAGAATIEHEGESVEVRDPEILPAEEANPRFPVGDQRLHRTFGVTEFLRVRRADRPREPEST